jgi:hypothetical protein
MRAATAAAFCVDEFEIKSIFRVHGFWHAS